VSLFHNLLAIDTATAVLSVALGVGKDTQCHDTWYFEADAGLRHSELLMDSIDMLMKKAGLKPEELSGVLCMGGPGSFTGLRIGFSLAKGLALSLGIPFAPIPTLDCMAHPFSAWPGIVVPVIDARKNAFFCALYQDGKQISPIMDAPFDIIAAEIAGAISAALCEQPETANSNRIPALLVGPDADKLYHALMREPSLELSVAGLRLGKGMCRGNARTLLEIAAETQILYKGKPDYNCGPEYIRKSDAEINFAPSSI
jgi:tRNA threonylcarbamoyladenosine biosynthesis protein TsaB